MNRSIKLSSSPTSQVTGLILAGGQSRRMGGEDKALLPLRGQRLIDYVHERLVPQVGQILINTNRNHDAYKNFKVRVISDAIGDFAGPLAGLHAGLSISRRPYLVTVPCDSPFFPTDLVGRLMEKMSEENRDVVIARTGTQVHPVFCLVRRGILSHLEDFLKKGGHKIDAWYASLNAGEVDFGDTPAFNGANTPEELQSLETGIDLPREAKLSSQQSSTHPLSEKKTSQAKTTKEAQPISQDIEDILEQAAATAVSQLAMPPLPEKTPSVPDPLTPSSSEGTPVDVVLQTILSIVQPIGGYEKNSLRDSLGRILAEDIVSPIHVPAYDNSAMDGWAIRSHDLSPNTPSILQEIGVALAGQPFSEPVGPGECVRIMTGAVMPQGCDTVVPQEQASIVNENMRAHISQILPHGQTSLTKQRILIPHGQTAFAHRRLAGEDLSRGAIALSAGCRLGAAELGLAASLGLCELSVRRRVRVAFFSTGDEIASLGEHLQAGQVYDSNRYTLFGLLTGLGVEAMDMGVIRDRPAELRSAFITGAKNADVVIVSGGVSVGTADYTRQILQELGSMHFWRVAMRPGRPMSFGTLDTSTSGTKPCYLFGLPGNPVAVMVTFLQFVRPTLLQMMGCPEIHLPTVRIRAGEKIRKKPGRTEYQRARIVLENGEAQVHLTGGQGSGILSSMSQADALVILSHEQGDVALGEWVNVVIRSSWEPFY